MNLIRSFFFYQTATPYSNGKEQKNHFKTPEKELKEQQENTEFVECRFNVVISDLSNNT